MRNTEIEGKAHLGMSCPHLKKAIDLYVSPFGQGQFIPFIEEL